MAKEITSTLKLAIASKGGSAANASISTTEDLAGSCAGFQATIGFTSAAAIALGSGITAPKVVYIQNNDASNFVTVDHVVGLTAWPQRILAGTAVILRPNDTTIYAKADTAPVAVWIVAG